MYFMEAGKVEDKKEQIRLYEMGAEQGETMSIERLVEIYENDEGEYYDPDKAIMYIKELLKKGDFVQKSPGSLKSSLSRLLKKTANGDNSKINESYYWLMEAAKHGDESALASLDAEYGDSSREKLNSYLKDSVYAVLNKSNKEKKDYYFLALFYIYGIVFDRSIDDAESMLDKAKGYYLADAVISRKCYHIFAMFDGKTNEEFFGKSGRLNTYSNNAEFQSLSASNNQGKFQSTRSVSDIDEPDHYIIDDNGNAVAPNDDVHYKSAITVLILAIFFGHIGVPHFYLGYVKKGAILLAISLLLAWTYIAPIGVWIYSFIDLFKYMSGKAKDANGNPLLLPNLGK